MAAMAPLPLRTPRIITLSLAWALGVVGGAVGINAIVKRNQQVAFVQNSVAASGIVVNVDTKSLVNPGVVLATGCALLGVVSSAWLGLILLDMKRKTTVSTRTLTLEWASMAFMSVWILATVIPVTMIARNGAATVTAFLGGRQLPDALVTAQSRSIGVDPAYWTNQFVRIQVIPPWFAMFFAVVATIVSFVASRRAAATSPTHPHSNVVDSHGTDSPIDKPVIAEKESV